MVPVVERLAWGRAIDGGGSALHPTLCHDTFRRRIKGILIKGLLLGGGQGFTGALDAQLTASSRFEDKRLQANGPLFEGMDVTISFTQWSTLRQHGLSIVGK